MKARVQAAVAAAALLGAEVGVGQTIDATDPERLVGIFQDLGYRAKLSTDRVGDPLITSSVGGTEFSIYFYGCEDNSACKMLLFKVGYDLNNGTTLDTVNAWNQMTLFGRAHLDDDNDPWLEMAVNLSGGVTRANIEDSFDWWEIIVEQFEDHIDW
jgi:hypothetical protein